MDRNVVTIADSDPTALRGERRRSVRQKLHSPVYVSFNGPQPGMVVDLSELLDLHENGFAVQTAIPTGLQGQEHLEVNRAVTLCLELPETRKYLHGSGQVMWTDNTGRAGIRFSFLPESSRQILKEWLFANLLVASTNHAARVEQVAHHQKEKVQPPLPDVSTRDIRMPDSPPAKQPLPQDFSAADKSPALTTAAIPVAVAHLTSASSPERAELLSALDEVRREVREIEARTSEAANLGASGDLDPILQFITRCALSLTGATGAALALRNGDKTLCRARAGDPAPPVGSEVDVRAGLSGECVRHGIPVACEDPENDLRVDAEVCRRPGDRFFRRRADLHRFPGRRPPGNLRSHSSTLHQDPPNDSATTRRIGSQSRRKRDRREGSKDEKKIEAERNHGKNDRDTNCLGTCNCGKNDRTGGIRTKKNCTDERQNSPSEQETDHQVSSLQSSLPARELARSAGPQVQRKAVRSAHDRAEGGRASRGIRIARITKYGRCAAHLRRRVDLISFRSPCCCSCWARSPWSWAICSRRRSRNAGWGSTKLAQNSPQTSQQASSSTSSLASSYSPQNTSGHQGRVLSPGRFTQTCWARKPGRPVRTGNPLP